jgi:hypothetical protein
MYFAAYQLSRRGWNVMPTARNARGIDLLAYDASGRHFLGIQVKALSRRIPVPLGRSVDNLMGDWWIIVTNVGRPEITGAETERPECFVLLPSEVRERAHRGEKDGRISYWLQPNQYASTEFREAWSRVGRGDQAAPVHLRGGKG